MNSMVEDLSTATSGQIPPVLYFSPCITQDNEESTVGGMTTDTKELTSGGLNSSWMNQSEYDNETGYRPQASISGDMRPSCPMFPTEQPSNLGRGGAGSGVDASKSSTRATTDSSSKTTTKWMTLRDRMLFRGAIFLALVVPICLFGYFAASGVFRGGREGGGLMANPTPAPVSSQGGTCGDGNVGNGICLDVSLCCSKFGFCGTTIEYCSDQGLTEEPMVPFSGPVPSGDGTCGDGNVGNAICLDATLCCSKYGWCGSTTEHCADWETTSSPTSAPISSRAGGTQAPISSAPSFGVRTSPTTPAASSSFSYGGTLALTSAPTYSGGGETLTPTPAPFSIEGGTCGDGNPGNGICPDVTACCSYFGWCGFGPEYCGSRNLRARGNTN
jgi:hypothetical protein